MTVLRRFARPMLASLFISGGYDAVRDPARLVPEVKSFVEPVASSVAPRTSLLPESPEQLVRLAGAVQLGAGCPARAGTRTATGLAGDRRDPGAHNPRGPSLLDDRGPRRARRTAGAVPQEHLDARRAAACRRRHSRQALSRLPHAGRRRLTHLMPLPRRRSRSSTMRTRSPTGSVTQPTVPPTAPPRLSARSANACTDCFGPGRAPLAAREQIAGSGSCGFERPGAGQ